MGAKTKIKSEKIRKFAAIKPIKVNIHAKG